MRSPLAYLLVATILLYRVVATRISRTRSCLYKQSCSVAVESCTWESGFLAGLATMRGRFSSCRPGYSFEYDDEGWGIVCVNGSRIAAEDASDALVSEAQACGVPTSL